MLGACRTRLAAVILPLANEADIAEGFGGELPCRHHRALRPMDESCSPARLGVRGPASRVAVDVEAPEQQRDVHEQREQERGTSAFVGPGEMHPVTFAVRAGSDPETFIPRLRTIVSEIEPSALIQNAGALDRVPDPNRRVLTDGHVPFRATRRYRRRALGLVPPCADRGSDRPRAAPLTGAFRTNRYCLRPVFNPDPLAQPLVTGHITNRIHGYSKRLNCASSPKGAATPLLFRSQLRPNYARSNSLMRIR